MCVARRAIAKGSCPRVALTSYALDPPKGGHSLRKVRFFLQNQIKRRNQAHPGSIPFQYNQGSTRRLSWYMLQRSLL